MYQKLVVVTVLILSSFVTAQSIEPIKYSDDYEFLCNDTHSFLLDNSALEKGVIWVHDKLEVAAISSSEFCGNLGCSAIVSLKTDTTCISHELFSVQTFIPISFAENEVQLENVSGCTSWKVVDGSFKRGAC